jgi:G6PDH family F420-dependent oxidoreductase
MATYGYALSSEEHSPNALVQYAQLAERSGFEFALISDHYHPWVDRQGQSAFVWCVLGAIAQTTDHLRIGTGVTCPLIRIHPAIIAQAAATAAAMFGGRFFLGLGTGENLNEHVVGCGWPEPAVRLEMFEEAVAIIRELWNGDECSYRGKHYTVEQARIYTLPDKPPPICLAADGEEAADRAGRLGDGLIGVSPERKLVDQFQKAGGNGKPRYGQITVCWAASEAEARKTAMEFWPTSGLQGNLSWEVKTPKLFEDAVKSLREDDVAESIICGPDAAPYLEKISKFQSAGFDHIYFHQVGPDQEGFFRFYRETLAPALNGATARPKQQRSTAGAAVSSHMAKTERHKKDGQRKDKKRQRMRAAVEARHQQARPPRPSRDEVDTIPYKRGSAADRTRRGAP